MTAVRGERHGSGPGLNHAAAAARHVGATSDRWPLVGCACRPVGLATDFSRSSQADLRSGFHLRHFGQRSVQATRCLGFAATTAARLPRLVAPARGQALQHYPLSVGSGNYK